jgi:hypothetical protein
MTQKKTNKEQRMSATIKRTKEKAKSGNQKNKCDWQNMSILRKEGKEKLRFKVMNSRVSNQDFKRLKRLLLNCLDENPSLVRVLDENYRFIQIYFFFESRDKYAEDSLRLILNDPEITYSPNPCPAFTQSRKKIGCILVFVKHLEEFTQKRSDIEDPKTYQKNGLFEELCHLAEQKGDSSIHPESYWELWTMYGKRGLVFYGNQILERLDTDRNHYEVFSMMLKAYPNDWVERQYKYFTIRTPDQYRQQFEELKKSTPIDIGYARLVTDFLRDISVLYVAEKAKNEEISEKNRKLLDFLIETGTKDVREKRKLIETEMGSLALSLIDALDETIFKTPETFFWVILDLWKNLKLINV